MEQSEAYQMGYMIGGVLGCFLMILLPILFILSVVFAIVKKSAGWSIVAVITFLIGLGFVGLSVFFAIKENAKSVKEGEKIEAVSSAGVSYALRGPSHWSKQSLGASEADVQWGNLFREEYLATISEPIVDFDESFDLDRYAELLSGLTSEGMEKLEKGDINSSEHPLYPARECRIEGTIEGIRIVYLIVYLEGEKDFYQLMMWTLPSKEEKAFPIFRKVAESFREGADLASLPTAEEQL